MSSKIEGIPDGWELVEIGQPKQHEFYIGPYGEPRACRWDKETTLGCAIIRKIEPPKPVYVPWTFETCPVGCVVKRKHLEQVIMIVSKTDVSCGQCGQHYLYDRMLADFEQLDGTPCGTIANEKKAH
jgi:hypothetical protein